MQITMIAAVSNNNVIGKDGTIPWNIPSDMKWFRKATKGKTVIMGMNTFESLNMPAGLPGRHNIVITSRKEPGCIDNLCFVQSFADALKQCPEDKGVYIIGGSRLYAEGMEAANKMYITHVDAIIEGDTYFPFINPFMWKPVSLMDVPSDPNDEYPIMVVEYTK